MDQVNAVNRPPLSYEAPSCVAPSGLSKHQQAPKMPDLGIGYQTNRFSEVSVGHSINQGRCRHPAALKKP